MSAATREPAGRRISNPAANLCAITEVGLVRENNEDDFYVAADGSLLMVADGLGGLPAGEVASRAAVAEVARCMGLQAEALAQGEDEARTAMAEAFRAAHERILYLGFDQKEHEGMATTLVAAAVVGEQLYTCHLGDVRAYHGSRAAGAFDRISRDHSLVADMVEEGRISSEEARVHPMRNVITRALGLPEWVDPSFTNGTIAAGDVVMLCSDGLWEAMSDGELGEISLEKGRSVRDRATTLVDRSMARGGRDNITVVLYEHA